MCVWEQSRDQDSIGAIEAEETKRVTEPLNLPTVHKEESRSAQDGREDVTPARGRGGENIVHTRRRAIVPSQVMMIDCEPTAATADSEGLQRAVLVQKQLTCIVTDQAQSFGGLRAI